MAFSGEFNTRLHEFMGAAIESPVQKLHRGMDEALHRVHDKWEMANEEVRGMFGTTHDVDEMALYFPERELLTVFLTGAVRRGWTMFNYAEDNVVTRPISGAYEVEYWFLRSPDFSYRLELMVLGEGFSPYHGSLHYGCKQMNAPISLAHASFKVPGEPEYAAVGVALRNAGLELAQHCESSYGRFSYYVAEYERGLPALKPRMNTRDQTAGTVADGSSSCNWGGDSGN